MTGSFSFTIKRAVPIHDLYSTGNDYFGLLLRSDIATSGSASDFAYADDSTYKLKSFSGAPTGLFIIDENDNLYVVGGVGQGGLGLGDGVVTISTLTYITDNVLKVSARGAGHTMILKTDGTVWGSGDNIYGQLGLGVGDTTDRWVFTQSDLTNLPGGTIINDICSVRYNSFLATNNGIFSCGYGGWANGHDDFVQREIFEVCVGTDGFEWTKLSGSQSARHMIILRSNNKIYSCGIGAYGARLSDDGLNTTIFEIVQADKDFKDIAIVDDGSFALTTNGILYGAGRNYSGELGLGHYTITEPTTQLATGVQFIATSNDGCCYVGNDNLLYLTGVNNVGQLGRGATSTKENTFEPEINGIPVDKIGDQPGLATFLLK